MSPKEKNVSEQTVEGVTPQEEEKNEIVQEAEVIAMQENMQDDEVIQASQHVLRIKVFATIAAMLVLVFLAILLWDSDEGYYLRIPTDAEQTWVYEIADTSMLKNTAVEQTDGKYKSFFCGLQEGETEIILYRVDNDDTETVLEKRIYHVSIAENLSVLQKSVEREVYE